MGGGWQHGTRNHICICFCSDIFCASCQLLSICRESCEHSGLVFASWACPGHLEEAAKSARLATKHGLDEVLMKREVMCLANECIEIH